MLKKHLLSLNSLLCTYYCIFSSRFGGDFPEHKEVREISSLNICSLSRFFVNASSNHVLSGTSAIFTADVMKVKDAIQSGPRNKLTGPKGCGKSFSLALLFLMLQKEYKYCLYLGSESLHNVHTYWYFLDFIEKHSDSVSYANMKEQLHAEMLEHFRKGKSQLPPVCFMKFLVSLSEENPKKPLYLFIDFGQSTIYEKDSPTFDFLLQSASIPTANVTVAVSSGALVHVRKLGPKQCDKFNGLFSQNWTEVDISGFTEDEAKLVVEKINCNEGLKFEQIRHLSGNNPLLLSILNSSDTLYHYKAKILARQEEFLERNLGINSNSDVSIKGFLEQDHFRACEKYIHYANTGSKLTKQEYETYHGTWLYANQVTSCKLVYQEHHTHSYVLNFNFPNLGIHLMKIIRRYLKRKTDIENLSLKERSVAGFLFQEVFFDHCREKQKLGISCIDLDNGQESNMTLYVDLIVDFQNQDKLDLGIMYELWSNHQVIDCVGYLKSLQGKNCLVYAQLSLQEYRSHRKLSDLIRTVPPKTHVPDHLKSTPKLTLFTFYLQLAGINEEVDTIIFIYVTPNDNEGSLLKQIQDDLRPIQKLATAAKIKARLNAGAIGRQAEFFSKLTAFQKNALITVK